MSWAAGEDRLRASGPHQKEQQAYKVLAKPQAQETLTLQNHWTCYQNRQHHFGIKEINYPGKGRTQSLGMKQRNGFWATPQPVGACSAPESAADTGKVGKRSLMSFSQVKQGLLQNWRVQLLWKPSNPLIYIPSVRHSVYTDSQQPLTTPYQAQPSTTSMEMDSQTIWINIHSWTENKWKVWLVFAGHRCAQTHSALLLHGTKFT